MEKNFPFSVASVGIKILKERMALASFSSSLGGLSSSSSAVSGRDFFDLVKAIGESKSKQVVVAYQSQELYNGNSFMSL